MIPAKLKLAASVLLALTFAPAGPALAAGSSLVLGMAIEPSGLDPTVAAPVAIGQVTWQNVFEGLTAIDRVGKVVPGLASDWTVSDDGRLYTFHLRAGVRFHDGTPFDAAVAKFSLDRARGDKSVNPQKRFFSTIEAIETPDPATLIVRLSKPTGSLPYWLAWPASVMLAPESAASAATAPVGTGPFRFKAWKKGDSVTLERNPDYWGGAGGVALEAVTFRFIGDAQAQAAALKSGGVDAFPEFAAPELMESFRDDPRLVTVVGTTELKVVAGMNNARKPFDDKRVRQALMLAVDRSAVIDGAWSGYGTPIGSHYTPNDPGYVDLTGRFPYDPEKARALLAEAGYPDGFAFTLKAPQMAYAGRTAEILQALFADVGVRMTIETTEFPAKWIESVFKATDYDMTVVAHAEPMDIDIFARDPYYFNYRNPAFASLLDRVEATSDAATRDRLYGEAQSVLADDVPALYLFAMPKLGVWDRRLTGLWENEPIPSNVLKDVRWTE